jgi:hypothetical protein
MLILILACLAILPACSDDNANDIIMGPGSDAAFVRVAHLSPDAPNVDVWLDGNVVLQDVPFRAFSGYLELASGDHLVQVTPPRTRRTSMCISTVRLSPPS